MKDIEKIKLLEKELDLPLQVGKTFYNLETPHGCIMDKDNCVGIVLNKLKLKELPQTLKEFSNLSYLDANNNEIIDISSISELKNLKRLSLYENQIFDINPISEILSLEDINFRSNQIEDISPLLNLKSLKELDISYNSIKNIDSISILKELRKLSLNGNNIGNIEPLQNLFGLESLDLWSNSITSISSLQRLTGLTKLFLGSNIISDIEIIKELKNLRELELVVVNLDNIEFLSENTNLSALSLWYNKLKDISPLSNLYNLTSLSLYGNRISDISSLKDLTKLTQIGLNDNKIVELPKWILETDLNIIYKQSFFGDRVVNFYQNPIENVPIEIIEQGKDAIKDYFKSLEEGSQPINEIKVILLGEGAAGKTSLMNYLQGKPYNEKEPQTHGINLEECIGESGVTMKIWDFGGQDIMHHTHQFFLTQKSVYVLVLNARENSDTEKWLKLIQVFGGDSPVIIVTNKIDENPSDHENIKYLNTKYPNLASRYVRISIAKGLGLDEFKDLLTDTIKNLLHVRTLWGNNWLGVKRELEEMRAGDCLKDFIHFDKYEDICENHGVVKSHRDTLIKWLHRLGVITYFSEPNLSETHVINPSWLTEAFYSIINAEQVAKKQGRFSLNDLPAILDKVKYPKQKYSFLLGLMTKFELCFKFDELNFLIPDLLGKEEPSFSFNIDKSLKFRLRYKNLLPKAILPKFIVRRHQEIKSNKMWRTGVVIQDDYFESVALVRVDEDEKEISVYVNGSEQKGYMNSIISNLESINKLYEGLEIERQVPCCCKTCKENSKPFFYNYDTLFKSKKNGRKTYPCGISDDDVSLNELLGVLITPEEMEREIGDFVGKGNQIIKKNLEEGNADQFILGIKSLFSSVSYLLFEKSEKAYHTPLFLVLRAIFDSKVRADEMQSKGRTDIVIELDHFVYILELKLDSNSEIALNQIYEKKYFEPYELTGKRIILIGINFSSKDRNISDYKTEKYN